MASIDDKVTHPKIEKIFLYIDILGFKELVMNNSDKVENIFKIIDSLHVHKNIAFQTIVFSDTILIFNKDNKHPAHYYVTYILEYAQQLFYRLSMINMYFKGIITLKPFTYLELKNVNAYYGEALISTYKDEKELKGFGLYIDKSISKDSFIFENIHFNEKYDYILLCQSLIKLYKKTKGVLPVNEHLLTETDDYYRIDEDLRFLREIDYYRKHINDKRISEKYDYVYNTYRILLPNFFRVFEKEGFLPYVISPTYIGSINPFNILAELEKIPLKFNKI